MPSLGVDGGLTSSSIGDDDDDDADELGEAQGAAAEFVDTVESVSNGLETRRGCTCGRGIELGDVGSA